eukprot:6461219-Amphidinium_carterae.1
MPLALVLQDSRQRETPMKPKQGGSKGVSKGSGAPSCSEYSGVLSGVGVRDYKPRRGGCLARTVR